MGKQEFIEFCRVNCGHPSRGASHGLVTDCTKHGKHQETLNCEGCTGFSCKISQSRSSNTPTQFWSITKKSTLTHGSTTGDAGVILPCSLATYRVEAQLRLPEYPHDGPQGPQQRIRSMKGTSSAVLLTNPAIQALRLSKSNKSSGGRGITIENVSTNVHILLH